jgi:hypothetical protein
MPVVERIGLLKCADGRGCALSGYHPTFLTPNLGSRPYSATPARDKLAPPTGIGHSVSSHHVPTDKFYICFHRHTLIFNGLQRASIKSLSSVMECQ